jgi:hypothetical protein
LSCIHYIDIITRHEGASLSLFSYHASGRLSALLRTGW